MNYQEDLKAFVDGELEPAHMDQVRAALETDPALKQEFQQLQALTMSLAVSPQFVTPIGMEETLAALRQRQKKPRFASWQFVLKGGFACATLLVVAIVWQTMNQSSMMAKNTPAASADSKFSSSYSDSGAKSASPIQEQTKAPPQDFVGGFQKPVNDGALPKSDHREVSVSKSRLSNNSKPKVAAPTMRSEIPSIVLSPDTHNAEFGLEVNSETVALVFDSPDFGEKQVRSVIQKYAIEPPPTTSSSSTLSSNSIKTVVIEVPESEADQTIAALRKLTDSPPSHEAGGMGGGGKGPSGSGGGGFGGAGGGGQSGGLSGNAADTVALGSSSRAFGGNAGSSKGVPPGKNGENRVVTATTKAIPQTLSKPVAIDGAPSYRRKVDDLKSKDATSIKSDKAKLVPSELSAKKSSANGTIQANRNANSNIAGGKRTQESDSASNGKRGAFMANPTAPGRISDVRSRKPAVRRIIIVISGKSKSDPVPVP